MQGTLEGQGKQKVKIGAGNGNKGVKYRIMFKEIQITQQMKENATIKSNDMGVIKGSVRGGGGNMIGFLGEELVKSYFNIGDSNTYQWDLKYNDNKLEVKTKERNVLPKPFYNATIFNWNTKQKCDYYVFCSVFKDFSKGYICGIIKPQNFYNKASFARKGDPDGNYFKFFSDCYNLPYSELNNINILD
jgi:hypothetical protein